ncbi:MAG: preprotein translocase subunit SecB [Saprospiraceae bacterium]|jgi:preprotein translocase subunit SecB
MTEEKTTVKEIRLEPRKVFLKDVSFESPMSPEVFAKGEVKPAIDVQLTLHHKQLEKTFHEVVLQITATSKAEEETLFLVEVHQAGIFEIACEDQQQLEMIKEVACANILLPFARETIADLVAKGGFPQLLLNPINFEALYSQKMKKQADSKHVPSSDSIN